MNLNQQQQQHLESIVVVRLTNARTPIELRERQNCMSAGGRLSSSSSSASSSSSNSKRAIQLEKLKAEEPFWCQFKGSIISLSLCVCRSLFGACSSGVNESSIEKEREEEVKPSETNERSRWHKH